jgi:hypothetical protein
MGFNKCVSVSRGEFRKFSGIMAAAFLLCGLITSSAFAGEVAGASDSLSVTWATAGVLPQASSSTESSLLSGLHISGYLNQTFGMW